MTTYLKNTCRLIAVVSGLFLSLYSCTDSAYDLNKGIDQSIKFGGDSLALPIGVTDTLFLKDLMQFDDKGAPIGNTDIEFNDTIDGLDFENMGDQFSTGELVLYGTAFNSIPRDITLKLTALDGNNKVIVAPGSQRILKGDAKGNATETDFELKLFNSLEELKKFKKVAFELSAPATSIEMKPNNFIVIELGARIKGGLVIKSTR